MPLVRMLRFCLFYWAMYINLHPFYADIYVIYSILPEYYSESIRKTLIATKLNTLAKKSLYVYLFYIESLSRLTIVALGKDPVISILPCI